MKISIGMSGGIDSSFAAYLLKQSGHEVTGFYLNLTDTGNKGSIADAKNVAEKLQIGLKIIDLRKEFREKILQYFIEEYSRGRTPNPCISCNRLIKFGEILFDKLKDFGDLTSTGHYARVVKDPDKDYFYLKKGIDPGKDQSYFLSTLNQVQLSRLTLPLGDYHKEKVRERVRELGLVSEVDQESQELCFIDKGHYSDFIRQKSELEFLPGPIKYIDGKELGHHNGLINYTVGQRKGLGISWPEPLYVIRIVPDENTVIVGENQYLFSRKFRVRNFFWVCDEYRNKLPFYGDVKIRYLNKPTPARISKNPRGGIEIEFEEPERAITPGQHACVYNDDLVVGGGSIE